MTDRTVKKRMARHKQKMHEAGFKRISLWIPVSLEQRIRALAKKIKERYLK